MFLYKLDNKDIDKAFLNNEIIQCPALLPIDEMLLLEIDQEIVVQLSNRSKYKAIIKKIQFPSLQKGVAEGKIEIVKK